MDVEEDLRPATAIKIAVLNDARNILAETAPACYIVHALQEIIDQECEILRRLNEPNNP